MKRLLFALVFGPTALSAAVQSPIDEWFKADREEYERFALEQRNIYQAFYDSVAADFAEFSRNPWKQLEASPPKPVPVVPRPVIDTVLKRDHVGPVKIDTMYRSIVPPPLPQPPRPVPPVPQPVNTMIDFTFFGTHERVRATPLKEFMSSPVTGYNVGDKWLTLNDPLQNATVEDVLEIRRKRGLPDFAFKEMLRALAGEMTKGDVNAQALLTGWLLSRCGYDMRLARDNRGELEVLYRVDGFIYSHPYFDLPGGRFWCYDERNPSELEVCDFAFPGGREVSLQFRTAPVFDKRLSPKVTINFRDGRFNQQKVEMLNDSSFVEFMLHYPKACINNDAYSPWQLYGNIPASDNLRARLYPQLKAMTDTLPDVADRVELLHKLCQAFPYGYDNDIWGEDFPFCSEQSWFYPASDCEDHAIHFSRLVRDILGLDCILVFLRGENVAHMITAVAMPEGFEGAYTEYDGKKYFFAEPTGGSSRIGHMWDNVSYQKSVIIPIE